MFKECLILLLIAPICAAFEDHIFGEESNKKEGFKEEHQQNSDVDCKRPKQCHTFVSNEKYCTENIRLVYGVSRSSCCTLCRTTGNCKCWSWQVTGECWLKADCEKKTPYRGFYSGTPIEIGETKRCWVEKNCKLEGDSIKVNGKENFRVDSFAKCCEHCRETTGCIAVSFLPKRNGHLDHDGTCSLKYTSGHERDNSTEYVAGYLALLPVGSCNISVGYVWGDDALVEIGAYPVTPAECCELCTDYAPCNAWNWLPENGGICQFHACTKYSKIVAYDGAISGLASEDGQDVEPVPITDFRHEYCNLPSKGPPSKGPPSKGPPGKG